MKSSAPSYVVWPWHAAQCICIAIDVSSLAIARHKALPEISDCFIRVLYNYLYKYKYSKIKQKPIAKQWT